MSPPDSGYNSPLLPTVSSSGSHSENLTLPQFVNPSNPHVVHDAANCCGDKVERQEQTSDSSDDKDEGDTMLGVDSQLQPSSVSAEVKEDVLAEEEEDFLAEDDPTKDKEDDAEVDVDPMIGVVESEEDEEDDPAEVDDDPMIGVVESEEDEEDNPTNEVDLTNFSGSSEDEDDPVGVKEGISTIDEGHPASEVDGAKLSDSDSTEDLDGIFVGNEEANPMISDKLNEMSLDSDSSVHLAAPFEPRRSSRNTAAKDKPYRMVVTSPKLSSGRKKPVFKMDMNLDNVSGSNAPF